jgi:UPF0755 protein
MADRDDRNHRRVRQRRGFVEVVNALLTLLVLGILVVAGVFLYGAHSFYAAGPIKADTTFVVEKGNNLTSVAQRLEAQGLIDSQLIFQIGGFAIKKQGQLKAGEFKLAANSSMYDVLKQLTEGKPVQHGVTIPEGFTIAQVVDKLNKDDKLAGTLTSIPPEGGILPQTYDYEPGASRQSVLDQMVTAQQKAVADVWATHDPTLPISTPDQLVILASIVEKETGVAGERGHVAAVFVNRLRKHMRLQSDPTIIYGITKGEAPLGRPLKRSEVEAATPYNTYQIDGLPPTPIDNPGIDALKAVANPDASNDVYFVAASTNPADGHLFSGDYATHRKNVAKLRAAERLQASAQAEADADAAEDALAQQQAAATGDASASTSAAASDNGTPPAPNQPAPSAAAATTPVTATDTGSAGATAADSGSATVAAPGPADVVAPNGAPIPMPPRPDESSAGDAATPAETPAETPAASTPAVPAVTSPSTATPARPTTRPSRPRPSPQDTFGG